MRSVSLFIGLALTVASLSSSAESGAELPMEAWRIDVAEIPPYATPGSDKPLTGAARFEAARSVHTDVRVGDFHMSPRFRHRFEATSGKDTDSQEHGFGPGPELVAPAPAPVFEMRTR